MVGERWSGNCEKNSGLIKGDPAITRQELKTGYLTMKARLIPKNRQIPKIIGRIKLAAVISLPEKNFAVLINEIESNPLFKRLTRPENTAEKVVFYGRFPMTNLSRNFYEIKEPVVTGGNTLSFDTEKFTANRKETASLIKELGVDKFEKYFLYNNEGHSFQWLSSRCGLNVKDVKKINNFVNEFSIHTESFNPSTLNASPRVHYNKIASVEKVNTGNGGEKFSINFFSPRLAQGRYVIKYEILDGLANRGVFPEKELKKIKKLIKDLELINIRKSTVYRVIHGIVKKQSAYLESGNPSDVVPFSQSELSNEIESDPGIISRAIYGRSIETPDHSEKPLKYFFPSKKAIRKNIIREIISAEQKPLTDSGIQQKLKEKFGLGISRRSVAGCRKELKIASVFKRKK